MQVIRTGSVTLHVQQDGPQDGRVVMFGNSLGSDLRVWDALVPLLHNLRLVRFDKRGHGLSDCPNGPYTIEMLAGDAAAVADALGLQDITFIGLSIGGLIGQELAASRPDLIKALVLMDTASKIGNDEMWQTRINAIRDGGLLPLADTILPRWFAKSYIANNPELALWRNMLTRTPAEGYIACCHAINAADLTDKTRALTIPVTSMAGVEDGSTPPDIVRATAELCGAPFHLIDDASHLPCVEKPDVVAKIINDFIQATQ